MYHSLSYKNFKPENFYNIYNSIVRYRLICINKFAINQFGAYFNKYKSVNICSRVNGRKILLSITVSLKIVR